MRVPSTAGKPLFSLRSGLGESLEDMVIEHLRIEGAGEGENDGIDFTGSDAETITVDRIRYSPVKP